MANLYERYCLPHLIDLACGIKPILGQREKIVPRASGEVLEVGIGTGRNLPYYDPGKVARLSGLDPGAEMHAKARRRSSEAGLPVELLTLSAEAIPADDASFDTVVITFTLCSIPEPAAALCEMRRVLRPGGRLLFCEHGLAPDAGVARWQRRLTPVWRRVAGNCHMDRDIPALLTQSGMELETLEQAYIRGPRVLSYNYWGVAAKRD